MKDEALKLALEDAKRNERHHTAAETRYWLNQYKLIAEQAVNAIKQALEAPVQPQVRTGNCLRVGVCASEGHKIQAQRQWVGLTDEEVIAMSKYDLEYAALIGEVQRKLKQKNT